jgi:glucose/arabinose dehydrogenase
MLRQLGLTTLTLALSAAGLRADLPKPIGTGLKFPESVTVGVDRKIYASSMGEPKKDGDGAIVKIEDGKATPLVSNLDDPKGITSFRDGLFFIDKKKVQRVDLKGKLTTIAAESAFPVAPNTLNDIAIDEQGTIYVSDSGNSQEKSNGAIYRISNGRVTLVADSKTSPALKHPNGLLIDSLHHLLVADEGTGELHRLKIADGTTEKLADGLGVTDGLAYDHFGRLFISDWKGGKVYAIARPGEKPVLVAEGFKSAADICLDPTGTSILVPDMLAGTLTPIPAQVPGAEVDFTPLPLQPTLAFPKLQLAEWEGDVNGRPVALRPIVLTHGGDGTNRIFLATQQGVIHVFPNDPNVTESKVFLDLQKKVRYVDKENEEGFLGLAFHPKFKENGEFFVFYTIRDPKQTNIISRFKVKKDNPNQADPDSEEELFRLTRPFWNHDGGTIVFGPDGYLYVALGDGGNANDPFDNGQNLKTYLGKVLRIDVDHKDEGKKYAIPKDNPFVSDKEAKGEIWSYGLRNPWRIAFDRKTGDLWCADVGQNLWEEIDLLQKGGNFGWSRREGLHPFGAKGVSQNEGMIDPIWEYHHNLGKSITGGNVYRGKEFPELEGHYLYADYITNKLWALKYDAAKKRVVANRPLTDQGFQVMSFGEDEKGEAYFMTFTPTGKGVYKYARK